MNEAIKEKDFSYIDSLIKETEKALTNGTEAIATSIDASIDSKGVEREDTYGTPGEENAVGKEVRAEGMPPQAGTELDREELGVLFQRLSGLLAANDLDSEDVLLQIKRQPGLEPYREDLNRLSELVEDFEYKKAHEVLKTVANGLGLDI